MWLLPLSIALPCSLQHANVVTTYLYELRPLDEVDGGLETLDVRLQSSMTEGLSQDGMNRMSCWKLYIVQEFCELVNRGVHVTNASIVQYLAWSHGFNVVARTCRGISLYLSRNQSVASIGGLGLALVHMCQVKPASCQMAYHHRRGR